MELYVLDREFVPLDLIDTYISFIWTERYSAYGDFTLDLPANEQTFRAFDPGRYLHLPESARLMQIQSVRRTRDHTGISILKVSGKSIESFFQDRVVIHNSTDGWRNSGWGASLATALVRRICIDGTETSVRDRIPNLEFESPLDLGGYHEVQFQDKNLYDSIKELCDLDDLGFRLLFRPDEQRLVFRVYAGVDRTEDNSVVFSPNLDNFMNVSYFRSDENFKNVAYVSHDDRAAILIVYRSGHEEASGISRRIMTVNANDIEAPTNMELRHRGRQELAKHNREFLFDGEIEAARTNAFVYGRDYGLGDIVQVDDDRNVYEKARVTEYIRSFDNDGLRAYPTLEAL